MNKSAVLNLENPVLKEQMIIFSERQNTAKPFEITDSDVEDAQFFIIIIINLF